MTWVHWLLLGLLGVTYLSVLLGPALVRTARYAAEVERARRSADGVELARLRNQR